MLNRVRPARERVIQDVEIPVGKFVAVTGVSGSGKSTLVNEILYKALANRLNRMRVKPGDHIACEGIECFDPVLVTDPPDDCPRVGAAGESLIDPIIDYTHLDGTAVIGGYVDIRTMNPIATITDLNKALERYALYMPLVMLDSALGGRPDQLARNRSPPRRRRRPTRPAVEPYPSTSSATPLMARGSSASSTAWRATP